MNSTDNLQSDERDSFRLSRSLKEKVEHFAEETGIGKGPIYRLGVFRIIEELEELEASLKTIGKPIKEMCPIYDKRCVNFAFVGFKKMLRDLPGKDRLEIEIAIERQRKRLNKKKIEEMKNLEKEKLEDGEDD